MPSPAWEAALEVRQPDGGGPPRLLGRFPYRAVATVADRGRVRKERFEPRAFRYAIEQPDRVIHLLVGHSYDRPLAVRAAAGAAIVSTLALSDDDDALSFEAELPPPERQPTWMRDALLTIDEGLMTGVSPGFTVPPPSAVANAENLEPEPGNPGVAIRVISAAVLHELSVVTRPAYDGAAVSLRDDRRARRGRYWWL